ncbi:MAG: molybdopterin-dependent oxidoreductase [Dehalococcoidales bacterium]|nr:molybdopterin-dependent oxidoreductase [Dehalococcoidales bacterium]
MNQSEEKIVRTTCASHCGGTCVFRVHVKDGAITRIESDDSPEPQLRACARGRAYRQRVYDPDRIVHPLRRVGERGEGKFERISWNEAFDTVAAKLKWAKEAGGPASRVLASSSGDINEVHVGMRLFHKLLALDGGYTKCWGVMSYQGGIASVNATFGTWRTTNTRDDFLNSRLIILWGWNPANTICGTNTTWYLARAREKGAKIIAIDPKLTDTGVLADEWIPIYPGTDSAMLIAMAYVMLNENLQDQKFLDKYTVGFEHFRDYVLGKEDGIAKTPAWAEKITGVPAATITRLAREYATVKPGALLAGVAPGRTAYGEQYHRAASTLAAMTGNVGVSGGNAAGRAWESGSWYPYKMPYGLSLRPEDGTNPVLGEERTAGFMAIYLPSGVHMSNVADFILRGKSGGYNADPKLLMVVNHNYLNQQSNVNLMVKALKKIDFSVMVEQVMTATAKFADIILPTATFLERNDIVFGVGTPFYGSVNKAIEPQGECKTHIEIVRELAKRLGITNYGNDTEEAIIKEFAAAGTEITNYEDFKREGILKINPGKTYVPFQKQIEDPEHNPFQTVSGKIEIYSQTWADMKNPLIPPVAQYIETWESRNDPLIKKYPLQCISTHFKRRTHGQFEKVPWLRELVAQELLINSADAKPRNIKSGDKVKVFNDRGTIVIPAKVTDTIVPGVIDVPQGAWYNPDKNGIDRGGCANVLTSERISPQGAFPYNTCLVQVEKFQEEN